MFCANSSDVLDWSAGQPLSGGRLIEPIYPEPLGPRRCSCFQRDRRPAEAQCLRQGPACRLGGPAVLGCCTHPDADGPVLVADVVPSGIRSDPNLQHA